MIPDAAAEAALIELVRKAARTEVMPRFRRLPDSEIRAKTTIDDLVTEADLRAEAMITEGVPAILPGAVVIGEEAVSQDSTLVRRIAEVETAVIVDPVDGTWNFANGLATFGMILAVTVRGETVLGLLYDPVMDDWVLARKGGGSWMCRPDAAPVRLNLNAGSEMGEASGFLSPFLFPSGVRERMAAAIPGFRRVWSLRCACQEYRILAQGRVDFSLAATLNPWDHAAGALAVVEAGGAVSLLDGRDYAPTITEGGYLLTARSPELLAPLRDRLGPLAS